MNDAELEAQKVRIQTLVDRWLKPLGFGWWHIIFEWGRTAPFESPTCAMECLVDWRYLMATVTVYLPNIALQDDERLEVLFVHELMHFFLKEMRWKEDDSKDSLDHEERVAQMLALAFIWVRDFTQEGKPPAVPMPASAESH